MVPKSIYCLTIYAGFVRTWWWHVSDRTLFSIWLWNRTGTFTTTRASMISLSCAKPPSTKYSVLWSSWKSNLPSNYFEYSSDNYQCFCFFTMVFHYTLRYLSHAQSLVDTLSYTSVLSVCTICAPEHSTVCATNGCLRKLQDCLR